jgi:hypothetical protein
LSRSALLSCSNASGSELNGVEKLSLESVLITRTFPSFPVLDIPGASLESNGRQSVADAVVPDNPGGVLERFAREILLDLYYPQ